MRRFGKVICKLAGYHEWSNRNPRCIICGRQMRLPDRRVQFTVNTVAALAALEKASQHLDNWQPLQ